MAEPIARRLAAITACDVAGYSRLMGEDESGTHARLRALCAELVEPSAAAHGGRIFKTAGDGMMIEFASAVDAVPIRLHCRMPSHSAMRRPRRTSAWSCASESTSAT